PASCASGHESQAIPTVSTISLPPLAGFAPLSRLRERGWGRGGFCFSQVSGSDKAVSSACRRPSYFLLRGQEKSNPKRRPPRLALAGHPARQVREAWPGFSSGLGQPLLRCLNSGIHAVACPREKASPSLDSPAARPGRPRFTA